MFKEATCLEMGKGVVPGERFRHCQAVGGGGVREVDVHSKFRQGANTTADTW